MTTINKVKKSATSNKQQRKQNVHIKLMENINITVNAN